ncbi:archaeoflavoprotein AfpA [Methanocaldococcus infernus ME]|uniref:Archaeoflavoprotein AfpA n=1 Tax=Methanocaldococcus infernus (strain DSM 11812 / JCM 15783 / ME) TaxID=573063 RepID=D5VT92_METIM|nr:archaeoflavoprotein AfpA [Methanocaldococcus infernus]ADG13795.1 archaeoflavoprotein AfpA [Methanocaldococcus infernus ME]
MLKVAWGITGCGDRIEEVVNIMIEMKNKYNLNVDVYVSKNGEFVLRWYKLFDKVKKEFDKVWVEKGPNSPFLPGKLQTGKYDLFIIAPATANTTAKIAHGIADTLITNSVAQGMKARVPTYIYPPDNKEGVVETLLPNGKTLKLYIRKVDVENVKKLEEMEGIEVLYSPEEIKKVIERHIDEKNSRGDQ